ncbi:hypothetical protein [Streptomyces cinereoruber]|uniref:hypothetical protein n=1 Tax=Streptomyces cinereoruber TaxID=67260 RepID=UPI00363F7968
MTDHTRVARAHCEHHYQARILGGHPLSVRICYFCRTPDWDDLTEQVTAIRAAARQAGGQQPDTTTPVCICGHQEQQHIEDVCQTCGCGDYLEPADARDVIERWRTAALDARARLTAAGLDAAPAAGPDDTQTDTAHPTRTVWVIEWHRAAKNEWIPDQPPYKHREDAVDEIARNLRHNPNRQLRLVRETTTWTVEEDETR